MKRAQWYLAAGAIAGFTGVFALHGRAAPPAALAQQKSGGGATGQGSPGPAAGPQPPSGPSQTQRSVSGRIEAFGYGELAAKVTISGGQITGLSVPVLRTADPTSQQIADQVIPMLRSEVLAAHSARINAVSGATYTSEAYAASVQSALDKLHFQ